MTTEKHIGCLEIESYNGGFHIWEVIQRGKTLVVGTACNVGLLESFAMQMQEGESLDEALAELHADLVVEANDGADYMARLS